MFGFIITIIWLTSGLLTISIYYLHSYQESYCYVVGSFIGFCLFVICVSYASIFIKISCGAHPQHHGAASRERKLTKTLFMMAVVSLLTWLPFTISLSLFATIRFRPLWMIHLLRVFIVLFYTILFYMHSECQTFKDLSRHSFDVICKEELISFALAPCNYQGCSLAKICNRLHWISQVKRDFLTLSRHEGGRGGGGGGGLVVSAAILNLCNNFNI